MKKIGVIGLGRMGLGIAENLVRRGFSVTGYDVNAAAAEKLAAAGGCTAESCSALAANADAIVISVFDAQQLDDVLFGETGAVKTLQPGAAVVIVSAAGRDAVAAAAEKLAQKGIHCIDAPMKGNAGDALAGNLFLMTAADPQVLKDYRCLLDAMAGTVYVVGAEPGMGQVAKTCTQAFFCLSFETTCEILALAASTDVDTNTLYELLSSTGCSSPMFKLAADFIRTRKLDGTGNPMSILAKDIRLAEDIARETGLSLPALNGVGEHIRECMKLDANRDIWAAVEAVEGSAGMKIEF